MSNLLKYKSVARTETEKSHRTGKYFFELISQKLKISRSFLIEQAKSQYQKAKIEFQNFGSKILRAQN